MTRIFLSSPDVSELEESYVLSAIRSGWIAPLGPDVDAFEQEVAARTGVGHAVALSSGTAALHLALVSWGVGPGDVVPTSTLTFAATANAIVYTGATPYFVDCDPATGNMSPELLDEVLTQLRADGARVPCIVPVDLLGKCADYTAITGVAESHGTRVLADAAESFGATHAGRPAGAWGDAAVLSFNGNKIMTTSGGGMLLTEDAELASHVRFLATQAREPEIHYEHKEIGYNYRMSNLLAALGRAQVERLDAMIERRRSWRERYASIFSDVAGVTIFGREGDQYDNCWLSAILVEPETAGWTSRELLRHLAALEIEARPLWKPMHLQPVHADKPARLAGAAEGLFDQGLSLPSGSALNDDQFDRVAGAINDFLVRK
ncbi:aminotransferase class I/II-fold pyridoxal phosphate-dependent enzyme [Aeromicrobium phragmitis]|uniref:Aminotransferase class I/II-fold pyridoxal phosphate-dependent enzyme n=1 Tax=Aeromicrobium phragmitis TaxID=2478914 RepID=A0A3L8PNX2_9ACTN|nr:aminotransferase class I/II-fold pyridoxal phosphate-dependent enzyme [Aeromicrobium phragmitis]RLV57096.1 aminotransferase class I/II-fold pyridoxal phosphate-dependent enzyme [Aeromicrobium phragmitis]